ncbi:MAG: hypothetical protein MUC76_08630 [Spirochaetes bacterium]|jgi:hypothetical protein|nr:hypothetical protein [Spirochaetota bacterium]
MIGKKAFWYMLMAGAIGLYLLVLAGFYFIPDTAVVGAVLVGILVLHASEIPHAGRIARPKGISMRTAAVKTMLFGFTWWLPLKKGIIDR